MNNWKWAQQRYKNDPEYLAILREENRRKCKEKYAKKKEQKKNGDTCNNADNNSISNGSVLPMDD